MPFFMLFYLILGVLSTCFAFFWATNETATPVVKTVIFIMMIVLPLSLFIWSIVTCWKKIEITDKGIRSSLFKKFLVRELTWEEITDIRLIHILPSGVWLFFSKTSLKGMSIGKAQKQKGQIQVMPSQKLFDAIKTYCPKKTFDTNIDLWK
jgi:hypothetical protein